MSEHAEPRADRPYCTAVQLSPPPRDHPLVPISCSEVTAPQSSCQGVSLLRVNSAFYPVLSPTGQGPTKSQGHPRSFPRPNIVSEDQDRPGAQAHSTAPLAGAPSLPGRILLCLPQPGPASFPGPLPLPVVHVCSHGVISSKVFLEMGSHVAQAGLKLDSQLTMRDTWEPSV